MKSQIALGQENSAPLTGSRAIARHLLVVVMSPDAVARRGTESNGGQEDRYVLKSSQPENFFFYI